MYCDPWEDYDGLCCGIEVEESTDIYTENEQNRKEGADEE